MGSTAQETLAELKGQRGPTAQEALESLRQSGPTVDVNRSPIELPVAEEQTYGGTGLMPEFTVTPNQYNAYEKEAAARGVDIHSSLEDEDLRSALGFSPNQAFSADFLSKKLAEKTGLPADQLINLSDSGVLEFYNPDSGRFTPVDGRNFSKSDLADFYGPTTAIAPAVVGGVAGAIGGPGWSIGFGASGAFIGEIARLQHGRELGVHDLSTEEIIDEGLKAFGLDLAFGTGGQAIGEMRRLGRKLLKPEGFTPEESRSILDGMGKHQEDVKRVNELLEAAGSKNRFKLDPVADSEDMLGLEMREAAAKTSQASKSARAAEIKANKAALQDLSRILNRVNGNPEDILSSAGAQGRTREAQIQLRAERDRIQDVADTKLIHAESEAKAALDELGTLNRREVGEELKNIVNGYSNALETTKNTSWSSYQDAIGQKVPGSPGYTEATRYSSNIQVPITQEIADAHYALRNAMKGSLLTSKAQGKKVLKGTKPTTTTTIDSPIIGLDGKPVTSTTVVRQNKIDLALLDDDIKEIRDAIRRGADGFSGRKMRIARDRLVNLRNDYLMSADPMTLKLLQDAEHATTIYKNFADESVFSHVLKRNADGNLVMGDVDAFRVIMKQDSGEMMRGLVDIAKKQPGGVEALQETALKFYKASVVPQGSTIMSRDLHNAFISKNEEVLSALFGDPKLIRFGELEARVAKATAHAKRVTDVLKASPLAKFGGIAPERMGKAVFQEGVSEKNIRQTLLYLDNPASSVGAGASFRDSVGREVYHRITTDGSITASKISNLLETQGGKLEVVFGEQYGKDLQTLRRMLEANALTVTGKEIPSQSLIGMFARAIVTPPLTKRGRMQTFVERFRKEAANKVINEAVRNPDILHSIVVNANKDVRYSAVLNILGQTGGSALAMDEN